MTNDYMIRLEKETDYRQVENLTREAFWNVYRPGCLEHYVLHQYRDREDFVPELDFVMERNGQIMGHVMYAHSEIKAFVDENEAEEFDKLFPLKEKLKLPGQLW